MKLAIVEIGGKQYVVSPGQKIQIEKLQGEIGSRVEFDKVLLISPSLLTKEEGVGGGGIEIGKPYLEGKKISAEILEQKRLPKVTVFKYHSKTRYKKKKGHRQSVTVVKVV